MPTGYSAPLFHHSEFINPVTVNLLEPPAPDLYEGRLHLQVETYEHQYIEICDTYDPRAAGGRSRYLYVLRARTSHGQSLQPLMGWDNSCDG